MNFDGGAEVLFMFETYQAIFVDFAFRFVKLSPPSNFFVWKGAKTNITINNIITGLLL